MMHAVLSVMHCFTARRICIARYVLSSGFCPSAVRTFVTLVLCRNNKANRKAINTKL